MFNQPAIKKLKKLPPNALNFLDLIGELDEQKQEKFSGGTPFTGHDRLLTRITSSLTAEQSTLSEYDRFGYFSTERRTYD